MMEDLNKIGELFYDGGIINLKSISIEKLNEQIEKVSLDEAKIKSNIYEMIENF